MSDNDLREDHGGNKAVADTPKANAAQSVEQVTKQAMDPYLAAILNGMFAGFLLILFSIVPGLVRFVFSLSAFYVGLTFFRKHGEMRHRVTLIIVGMVVYLVGIVIYLAFAILFGWRLPGKAPDAVPDA